MARDGVDGVVAAHVLDELFDAGGFAAQCTAVYSARVFIDFVVFVE